MNISMNQSSRKKGRFDRNTILQSASRKVISGLLAFSFLFCNQAAFPSAIYAQTISGFNENTKEDVPIRPTGWSSAVIPSDYGRIQESFRGTTDQAVFLIQDAHAIPDAQKNIQNLIEYLQKQFGVTLVALEGAGSRLDARFLRSFPDRKRLDQVLEGYRGQGELTGVSAAAIFSEHPSVYQGIEDWNLYEEGMAHFQRAVRSEEKISAKLAGLRKRLEAEMKNHYSKDLLELDQALENFYVHHGNLLEVLAKLARFGQPEADAELALLAGEIRQDSRNEDAWKSEVLEHAKEVKRHLFAVREDLRPFNDQFQKFQTSEISAEDFALFLKGIAEKRNILLRISEPLARAMSRRQRFTNLEGTRLFGEFEQYVKSLKQNLFKNDLEKRLDRQSHLLRLFEKLAKLELTREEWEEIKVKSEKSKGAGKNKSIDHSPKTIEKAEIPTLLSTTSDDLWTAFSAHRAFYENAEKRDGVFFENLSKLMKSPPKSKTQDPRSNASPALLVAGGFHTAGLTKRLKDAGISYCLITPAMNSIPDETPYREQMMGRVSWKDYFKVENGKVNLYKAFVRAVRDRLLEKVEGKSFPSAFHLPPSALLKQWRDQILRDLADENRIARAREFTAFIDEVSEKSNHHVRPEWEERLDRLIGGLRRLDQQKQFTAPNILNLLKSSTMGAAPVCSALGTRAALRADIAREQGFLSPAIRSVSRSEKSLQLSADSVSSPANKMQADAAGGITLPGRAENRTDKSGPALDFFNDLQMRQFWRVISGESGYTRTSPLFGETLEATRNGHNTRFGLSMAGRNRIESFYCISEGLTDRNGAKWRLFLRVNAGGADDGNGTMIFEAESHPGQFSDELRSSYHTDTLELVGRQEILRVDNSTIRLHFQKILARGYDRLPMLRHQLMRTGKAEIMLSSGDILELVVDDVVWAGQRQELLQITPHSVKKVLNEGSEEPLVRDIRTEDVGGDEYWQLEFIHADKASGKKTPWSLLVPKPTFVEVAEAQDAASHGTVYLGVVPGLKTNYGSLTADLQTYGWTDIQESDKTRLAIYEIPVHLPWQDSYFRHFGLKRVPSELHAKDHEGQEAVPQLRHEMSGVKGKMSLMTALGEMTEDAAWRQRLAARELKLKPQQAADGRWIEIQREGDEAVVGKIQNNDLELGEGFVSFTMSVKAFGGQHQVVASLDHQGDEKDSLDILGSPDRSQSMTFEGPKTIEVQRQKDGSRLIRLQYQSVQETFDNLPLIREVPFQMRIERGLRFGVLLPSLAALLVRDGKITMELVTGDRLEISVEKAYRDPYLFHFDKREYGETLHSPSLAAVQSRMLPHRQGSERAALTAFYQDGEKWSLRTVKSDPVKAESSALLSFTKPTQVYFGQAWKDSGQGPVMDQKPNTVFYIESFKTEDTNIRRRLEEDGYYAVPLGGGDSYVTIVNLPFFFPWRMPAPSPLLTTFKEMTEDPKWLARLRERGLEIRPLETYQRYRENVEIRPISGIDKIGEISNVDTTFGKEFVSFDLLLDGLGGQHGIQCYLDGHDGEDGFDLDAVLLRDGIETSHWEPMHLLGRPSIRIQGRPNGSRRIVLDYDGFEQSFKDWQLDREFPFKIRTENNFWLTVWLPTPAAMLKEYGRVRMRLITGDELEVSVKARADALPELKVPEVSHQFLARPKLGDVVRAAYALQAGHSDLVLKSNQSDSKYWDLDRVAGEGTTKPLIRFQKPGRVHLSKIETSSDQSWRSDSKKSNTVFYTRRFKTQEPEIERQLNENGYCVITANRIVDSSERPDVEYVTIVYLPKFSPWLVPADRRELRLAAARVVRGLRHDWRNVWTGKTEAYWRRVANRFERAGFTKTERALREAQVWRTTMETVRTLGLPDGYSEDIRAIEQPTVIRFEASAEMDDAALRALLKTVGDAAAFNRNVMAQIVLPRKLSGLEMNRRDAVRLSQGSDGVTIYNLQLENYSRHLNAPPAITVSARAGAQGTFLLADHYLQNGQSINLGGKSGRDTAGWLFTAALVWVAESVSKRTVAALAQTEANEQKVIFRVVSEDSLAVFGQVMRAMRDFREKMQRVGASA